jgi:hypothetical protein
MENPIGMDDWGYPYFRKPPYAPTWSLYPGDPWALLSGQGAWPNA